MRPFAKPLIAGLVLVVAFVGWTRLSFDAEVLNLLPEEIPAVKGLKWHQEHFSNADETVLTLSHPDPEIASDAAESLADFFAAETEFVASVEWQSPFSQNADALAEILAWRWTNESPENFSALAERMNPDNAREQLREVREQLAITFSPEELVRLSRDPFGLTQLPDAGRESIMADFQDAAYQSPDGTFRVIYLGPANSLKDYKACVEWISFIDSSVRSWKQSNNMTDGPEIGVTGRPAFVAETSTAMKRDMEYTIPLTVLIIVALFLTVHRRILPLIGLIVLLAVIIALTLAAGGFIFGTLNAISLGFAAILLGVTADFALVLYQDWKTRPDLDSTKTENHVTKGILWSALTTSMAFASLALGKLPGLRQLGLLVAVGVVIGAVLMVFFYLRIAAQGNLSVPTQAAKNSFTNLHSVPFRRFARALPFLAIVVLLAQGPPGFDASIDPLQPAESRAQDTSDLLRERLSGSSEPYLLFLLAEDDEKLRRAARELGSKLDGAVSESTIEKYVLPVGLLADVANQNANEALVGEVVENFQQLTEMVIDAGFTQEALTLTRSVVTLWETSLGQPDGQSDFQNSTVAGLQRESLGEVDGKPLMMGLVYPGRGPFGTLEMLESEWTALPDSGQLVIAGWQLLGEQVLTVVRADLLKIAGAMAVIILVALGFAFRNLTDWLRAVGGILGAGLLLTSVMSLLSWKWNLMNLTAVPLLLGLSVDYSIHTQLAMRRYANHWGAMWRSTGSALLLCALTTAAGFFSLTFSSGEGLQDLGAVCGIGVLCAWVSSVCVLPSLSNRGTTKECAAPTATGPSALYGALFWRIGTLLARVVPGKVSCAVARSLGDIYRRLGRKHAETVRKNLLPLVEENDAEADAATIRLFRNFSEKLVDLWRFEAGLGADFQPSNLKNGEILERAFSRKRGVLLVTLHLGNWEVGGPILAQKGIELFVVTNPEPTERLTKMRERARARLGIKTIVVGEDAFQFINVVNALESGAAVAMLMDRPSETSGTEVNICGQTLSASSAAAELARATGCAILPVCILKQENTFTADILGEVEYSRPQLRRPEIRRELTQKIMREFEAVLRKNPDQWYQFVPVWKKAQQ